MKNPRLEIERKLGMLTDAEFQDFLDLVNFGFDRIKAGEEPKHVYQEWLSGKEATA